jgi:hypothetical protein
MSVSQAKKKSYLNLGDIFGIFNLSSVATEICSSLKAVKSENSIFI